MARKHVLHGSEGHDSAKDRVGREQDELTVRLKAVVHLVTQGRVVPAGWEALKENIKRQKTTYHISHGDIVAHVRGNVDAQVLLLPWQVEGNVVHVPDIGVLDHHLDVMTFTFHVLHHR